MARRKADAECAYCGRACAPSDYVLDHVIASGFLCSPRPSDGHTSRVPQCLDCKAVFDGSEARVRDVLIQAVPVWETRFREVVARSTRGRIRAKARNPLAYPTLPKILISKAGIVARRETAQFRQADLDNVFFRKMARGLFYIVRRERMCDVPFKVGLLTGPQNAALEGLAFKPRGHGHEREIMWAGGQATPDPKSIIWLFQLYGYASVGVWTNEAVALAPRVFAKGLILGGNPDNR